MFLDFLSFIASLRGDKNLKTGGKWLGKKTGVGFETASQIASLLRFLGYALIRCKKNVIDRLFERSLDRKSRFYTYEIFTVFDGLFHDF